MDQATQPLSVPMLHAIQVALSFLRNLLHIRWTLTHDGISLLSGQVWMTRDMPPPLDSLVKYAIVPWCRGA